MRLDSDEQIYADMLGEVTREDVVRMKRLMTAWADTMDKMDNRDDIRTVFLACVNTIGTMGPAWCRIAAATLLQRARDCGDEPQRYGTDPA